ncbi:hypothetical protein [Paraburkholderia hospita]|jgi:hypothetical protein|uniref:hypothetical protein n=1 Tax=Paraburkholderia hospita TaxID=169430 RepID=UPI001054D03E|nr:hypothetical protein [Paraburkholderia hospita]
MKQSSSLDQRTDRPEAKTFGYPRSQADGRQKCWGVSLTQSMDPEVNPTVNEHASLALLNASTRASRNTVADNLVHRRLGDAVADRQALAMPGTVVDQHAWLQEH